MRLLTPLLVVACVSALAVLASVVIARSSNRSAALNMALGALLGLAVFAAALLAARLFTYLAF